MSRFLIKMSAPAGNPRRSPWTFSPEYDIRREDDIDFVNKEKKWARL